MPARTYQVYRYRWVDLGVFSLINLTIQMLWICFAPITGPAARFYGVSDLQIGLLAMSFMVVYLPLSIPIAWAIDTLGYRKAVSIGAVLMGVFGLLRGLLAADYTWVLITTLGIAIAQPFLLNSISTIAAKWFPLDERATASGLVLVANFIGTAIGLVMAPLLTLATSIPSMVLIFGGIAAASSVIFLIFTREAPPTPPCPPDQVGRALMFDGLKSMLKMKDMWLLLGLFLVGMGIFNGISTWIEDIVRPKGFSITQAGNLGAFLLVGGIFGAALVPMLSDRLHKRKFFLLLGVVLSIPSLIGLTFAVNYALVAVSMLALGFTLMSVAPIGYQYAAEITFPAPEGTSAGLLNLAGQASVVFIFGMEAFKAADGAFTSSLAILVGLLVVSTLLVAALTESPLMRAPSQEASG
jgi:MFS family permease